MDRFEIVNHQELTDSVDFIEILKDKHTGVMYIYRRCFTTGGLTVLVDKDGKPQT